MTESFGFKLTLDAAGANRALDETRKKAESLGGGYDSLQKSAAQLKERLEKQAAAIAIVSQSLGQHDSAIGKTVSAVGTLAAAYGAGGPFGLALAAAIPLVEAMNQAFKDQAQGAAAYSASVAGIGPAVTALTNQGLKPARDALASIREEFLAIGQTAADMRLKTVGDAYQATSKNISSLESNRSAFMQRTDLDAETKDAIAKITLRRLEELRASQQQQLAEYETAAGQVGAINKANAPKAPNAQQQLDTAAAEEEALRNVQKVFYGQRLEANKRYHEQIIQNAKEAAKEELKVAEDAAKEQQKIDDQIAREGGEELMNAFLDRDKQMQDARDATAKAEMDAQRSATMELTQLSGSLAMALGSATAATFQGIEGQKAAFESLVSSASQAIGGYIMMKGGQVLAEGIASELALPGNPLGIAQIAGGTGLIAAGAAIQTGGPMAVQALMGKSGAASGGAATGGGAGTTDAGASTLGRSSSGSYRGRGSGDTVINITYGGASGPTAEQGAQAVVSSLRRAGRRGLTPLEVR